MTRLAVPARLLGGQPQQVQRALDVDLVRGLGRELGPRRQERGQVEDRVDLELAREPLEQALVRMSPTIAAPVQRVSSGSSGFRSRATTSYRPDSPSRGMRPCPISPFAPVTRTAGLRAIAPIVPEGDGVRL